MIDYIAWIDEQLAVHEREIAKLTIARDVILTARGDAAAPSEPVRKRTAASKKNAFGVTQKWVLDAMLHMSERGVDKATSGMVLNTVKETVDQSIDPKQIYNALYNAAKSGKLIKNGREFSIRQNA